VLAQTLTQGYSFLPENYFNLAKNFRWVGGDLRQGIAQKTRPDWQAIRKEN